MALFLLQVLLSAAERAVRCPSKVFALLAPFHHQTRSAELLKVDDVKWVPSGFRNLDFGSLVGLATLNAPNKPDLLPSDKCLEPIIGPCFKLINARGIKANVAVDISHDVDGFPESQNRVTLVSVS